MYCANRDSSLNDSYKMTLPESIGWTINGITPRPTAVVIHLRVFKGSFGATFASENKEPAQILLIVNPEIKALLERGRPKKILGRN